MIALTIFPSLFVSHGREVQTTMSTVLARVRRPRKPRWAFCAFRGGHRSIDDFLSASAITLDYDHGADAETIGRAFGDLCGFGHSTKRSRPSAERWRVVVFPDRPVDREKFPRVRRAVVELGEREGLVADEAAASCAHVFAVPAQSETYQSIELGGALLDVEHALDRFPPPAPPEPVIYQPSSNDLAQRIERARRYVERMEPSIAGAQGHRAAFKAALAIVVGFEVPPPAALQIMLEVFNPRCSPPWSVRELAHKVASAERRSNRPRGWLAGRPRERRSA
jgi:hypothetical protein